MAHENAPDKPGGNAGWNKGGDAGEGSDLETRRKALDAALNARTTAGSGTGGDRATSGGTGYATALRLSSEFVAGIVVGAVIGYLIDLVAGTSPWGLIVFLLLGFVAGVLNVLRSAGLVAEPKPMSESGGKPDDE